MAPNEQALAAVQAATTVEEFSALRDRLSNRTPAAVRLRTPVGLMPGLELFLVPQRVGSRLLAPHLIGYLDHAGHDGVGGGNGQHAAQERGEGAAGAVLSLAHVSSSKTGR